jgi:hypothetical protein
MAATDKIMDMSVPLPPDVWQLLFNELASRNDFSSLYNCAVASKILAGAGALANLYRYCIAIHPTNDPVADIFQCEPQRTCKEWRQQ